ncbi:MRP protein, putative [Eimeria necatrix]|uniref:MRP protein, putative n=1 Tax=Eimeria necatrix TaxID=51315 RepID=U6MKG0_9EIME|nr:MRP protein, putative [Eimeria necatrix]CDJ63538.1 MRP protein, putative [Eimeria necatrix]
MDPDLVDAELLSHNQAEVSAQAQDAARDLALEARELFEDSHQTVLRAFHGQVLSQLRQVKDPDIGRDIVSLGFVKDLQIEKEENGGRNVKFCLCLTTPACPFKSRIQEDAESVVKQLPWVRKVDVALDSMTANRDDSPGRPRNLRRVEYILGVASCKGGSGKSTVALSLALMLRKSGAKVGLLDADIYGPSLPTMLNKEEARVRFAEKEECDSNEQDNVKSRATAPLQVQNKQGTSAVRRRRIEYEDWSIQNPEPPAANIGETQTAEAAREENLLMVPLVVSGIKCMSYGFITKKNYQGHSALRGPFVSSVVQQMLTGTHWGILDYLVVDLPPGTGDIHITLTQQQAPLDGCVVVTTPQALSLVDAEKGIRMLKSVCIPTLAVVCNMAYFVCDSCDKRHELFGRPEATQRLAELSAARQLVLLPLDARLNSRDFAGSPVPDARDSFVDRLGPEDPVWNAIRTLADRVACELSTIRYGSLKPEPSLAEDGSAVLVALLRPEGALLGEGEPLMMKEVFEISGEILRSRCSCSECRKRQSEGYSLSGADDEVHVAKLVETNNGTLLISWKDGHETAFALNDLLDLRKQLRLATADEEGSKCHAPELEW